MAEHITIDPEVCSGKPCITGTRLCVWDVADTVSAYYKDAPIGIFYSGAKAAYAIAKTIDYFPKLTEQTIAAALRYAKQHPRPE